MDGIYDQILSVVFRINRSCKPANPAFTMSKEQESAIRHQMPDSRSNSLMFSVEEAKSLVAANSAANLQNRTVDSANDFNIIVTSRFTGAANLQRISRLHPEAGMPTRSSRNEQGLVEPIGIEPTTSSLQSSRSPN